MYGALVTAADSTRTGLRECMQAAFRPRTGPPSASAILRSVLWPAAILSVLHRAIVLTTNGNITDDFKPVYRAVLNFRRGWDIYNEHFDYVDPHYLYPPGGTLLMAPFGYLPFAPSRYLFISINTAAILLAAYLLLRLFNFTLTSVAAPALVLAMFTTETVTNTLVFTNINGCILLLEVLFLRWLLDGRVSHQWWAGIAIGFTLVLKPLLGPLLLLPLLNRQWRTLVTAIVIPIVINLAALPLINHPVDFFTRTLPYILGTRDYFNSSIQGNGIYFGLPTWLILFLRLLFTAIAIASLWLLYRYYRTRDPLFWFTTSSGVLLLWSWLAMSLAQGYYSMMLFPFLMAITLRNSVIRNWPAWMGIYGFMTLDRWLLFNWMRWGRALEYLKITYGWSLLLIVTFTVLYFRYLDAKAEDRLDSGIDPAWLTAERERASVDA
ncbi:arabinofuranan 3-O-arabinosyltransferase [Mycobacterium ulcerans]|uniref:arabinofuranan 3-O-arabinosyltransferase n=1 Tax=Mycobacterium ulcerans TaxID=1809 RepID=UPI0012DF4612|nr:arabinofuranan 3-O-arabinosyltransferase [Mycobacterium ulcerans]MEB3970246.1 arabinofuranan 3-O-arabinosyltransferase [Mycobacterium ulcerans]MEB3978504.1 arabinofuranan 3-O-arabinosyltransferase [Mycobacterium ulcerans]MEB4007764.1 arabinofuranan 3-O-arabinosyltransferase [Mycobacterium ulcerans]MEB4417365.1 arabinofuranan 3-O-arabinosyltransferase [Mycobacterium ulcerans]MEB4435513.1 arabinofuranan 3-O-arabinosyltransferase [Mycobacterium ulcerans]